MVAEHVKVVLVAPVYLPQQRHRDVPEELWLVVRIKVARVKEDVVVGLIDSQLLAQVPHVVIHRLHLDDNVVLIPAWAAHGAVVEPVVVVGVVVEVVLPGQEVEEVLEAGVAAQWQLRELRVVPVLAVIGLDAGGERPVERRGAVRVHLVVEAGSEPQERMPDGDDLCVLGCVLALKRFL